MLEGTRGGRALFSGWNFCSQINAFRFVVGYAP